VSRMKVRLVILLQLIGLRLILFLQHAHLCVCCACVFVHACVQVHACEQVHVVCALARESKNIEGQSPWL
jgi:hypothetical protein